MNTLYADVSGGYPLCQILDDTALQKPATIDWRKEPTLSSRFPAALRPQGFPTPFQSYKSKLLTAPALPPPPPPPPAKLALSEEDLSWLTAEYVAKHGVPLRPFPASHWIPLRPDEDPPYAPMTPPLTGAPATTPQCFLSTL